MSRRLLYQGGLDGAPLRETVAALVADRLEGVVDRVGTARKLIARWIRELEEDPPEALLALTGARLLQEGTLDFVAEEDRRRHERRAFAERIVDHGRRIDKIARKLGEDTVDQAVTAGVVDESEREAWVRSYIAAPTATDRALEEARESQWARHASDLGIETEETRRLLESSPTNEDGRYFEAASERLGIPKEELI